MTTNHLDPPGLALLERLASGHEPGLFANVPDASGTDRHDALRITVDAARRVVAARVLDLDRLRHVDPFVDAVHEAFAAADGARALASLELNGTADSFLARAEATMSGRAPARAPRPPDIRREARQVRARHRSFARPEHRPGPVSSDNAYVTVQRGPDGRLMHVDVDAEWLCAARPDQVERAVIQACRFVTEG
jgi:hypothetical protein